MRIFQFSALIFSAKATWVEIYSQTTLSLGKDDWHNKCTGKDACTMYEMDADNWIDMSKVIHNGGDYTFKIEYDLAVGKGVYNNVIEWTQNNFLFVGGDPGVVAGSVTQSGGSKNQECFNGLYKKNYHKKEAVFATYWQGDASCGKNIFWMGVQQNYNQKILAGENDLKSTFVTANSVKLYWKDNTQSEKTTPCPSDACWTFANNVCTLKAGCTSLTCDATSISFGITPDVFGIENTVAGTSLALAAQDIEVNGKPVPGYGATCKMGECAGSMSHSIVNVNGKDKLQFVIEIKQEGSSRVRTLSADPGMNVADKQITLGEGSDAIQINTAPFGVGLRFTCNYDLNIQVTSEEFEVKDVTITGTETGSGSLDKGFALTVTAAAGHGKIILGSNILVTAKWSVTLTGIEFHFQDCSVVQDTKEVAVVKDKCFAKALEAGSYTDTTDGEISFLYKSFTIADVAITGKQNMKCTILVCNDACKASSTTTCPADKGFDFTYNGN